jgi:outer membrane protein assembly factor BamB
MTRFYRRGFPALAAGLLFWAGHLACSPQWPMYRNNWQRTGSQVWKSPLADPARVPSLAVRHQFPATGAAANGSFYASPIVAKIGNGYKVYIGSGNGRFYALNGDTLAELWEYPPAPTPTTLTSNFTCNPSSFGIASTATTATINGTDAVIFGAPDHSGGSIGDGHLFALNAQTGALIWRSDVVAHVTGTTPGSLTEKHEQIGFSAPLVWNNHVLVGVADHCDDPIQKGRLVAVRLTDGHIDTAFNFCAVSSCTDNVRGGGIWSSPAAYDKSVYVTTGNVKESFAPTEPAPDNALSIVKVDQASGAVQWRAQPVSFNADADPDFSSTPSVGSTSCGVVALATEKDGWTHAVVAEGAGAGNYLWSFPPPPHALPFTAGDGTVHGDDDYKRSGALWADVYITMNGGLNLMATSAATSGGLHRLHAFNVCDANQRLRWLVDVPHASGGYALGQPTVTRGIVYVGTNEGHLVAIADPTLAAPPSYRCSNPDVTSALCITFGYQLVPNPAILADVAMPDGLMMVYNEPALSANSDTDGRVYVATHDFGNGSGHVYELTP